MTKIFQCEFVELPEGFFDGCGLTDRLTHSVKC